MIQISTLIFEILDMSGESAITIIDLIQICAHFSKETAFGKQVHSLLDTYVTKNLRPRFVALKLVYNLHTYQKAVSISALHKQLEYVFFG